MARVRLKADRRHCENHENVAETRTGREQLTIEMRVWMRQHPPKTATQE